LVIMKVKGKQHLNMYIKWRYFRIYPCICWWSSWKLKGNTKFRLLKAMPLCIWWPCYVWDCEGIN
jgi:hypothetical protein